MLGVLSLSMVFFNSHLSSFYPQNHVQDPRKLGVRVLIDASVINLNITLYIFKFEFVSISLLKDKNYYYWQ